MKKVNISEFNIYYLIHQLPKLNTQIETCDNSYNIDFIKYLISISHKTITEQLISYQRETLDIDINDLLSLYTEYDITDKCGIKIMDNQIVGLFTFKRYFIWCYIDIKYLKQILILYKDYLFVYV